MLLASRDLCDDHTDDYRMNSEENRWNRISKLPPYGIESSVRAMRFLRLKILASMQSCRQCSSSSQSSKAEEDAGEDIFSINLF